MSDEPIFLNGNYVTRFCDINPTSNSTYSYRAYDNQRETYWSSAGESTDGGGTYNTKYEVIFKNAGGGNITRNIDRVCLRNINLKQFKLQYSTTTGGTYSDIPGTTFTTNSKTDIYITFTKLTGVAKVRLAVDKTFPANNEKIVGEFIIAELNFTAETHMSAYDPSYPEKSESYRLEDGTQKKYFEYRKYKASIDFLMITESFKSSLYTLKTMDAPFLFYPEPDKHEGEMIEVNWMNKWNAPYSHRSSKARYNVSVVLEAV